MLRIKHLFRSFQITGLILSGTMAIAQVPNDSSKILAPVTVKGNKQGVPFQSITPTQQLNKKTLQQLNVSSVGDAAKYFSGVLVKDYGGLGGLKTVSVRNLGAAHTGVIYDGLPVADAQSGVVDLGRFSTNFLQSVRISNSNEGSLLQPARALASGAVISINSDFYNWQNINRTKLLGGFKAGSFSQFQPSFSILAPIKNQSLIGGSIEWLHARGDYPFVIENGNQSTKTRRTNADIESLQGELNFAHQFSDSATVQGKFGTYLSERGLPGAVIFFNEQSSQRLWNRDYFLQGGYRKKFAAGINFFAKAKYNNSYTRYLDPEFLNAQHYLENIYRQQEYYGSAGVSKEFSPFFSMSVSSDGAYNSLTGNRNQLADPTRLSSWNALSAQLKKDLWQINGTILFTHLADNTSNDSSSTNNRVSPVIAMSLQPGEGSPLMFRAFYKNIFRAPTFNDLYYTHIGNNDLRPEITDQYNLGMSYSNSDASTVKFNLSLDGWYNKVKDKIIAIPNKNLFVWSMTNLGKVKAAGLDLTSEISGLFAADFKWFSRLAYTLQKAVDVTNKSAPNYRDIIPYTPMHSGSFLLQFNQQKWQYGYSLIFSSKRYAQGDNHPINEVAGFAVQDLFAGREIVWSTLLLNLKLELNNIFNQHYEVIRYYPMPGRNYKISLTIKNL